MREVKDFNEGWRFKKGGCKAPEIDFMEESEPAAIPHTWYEDGDYYQGDAFYQKVFDWKRESGKKVFLSFEGVDKSCCIYLNGVNVGEHRGAYSTFRIELTKALKDGINLLTVLVNNEKGTRVNPISGDFTLFGGIYRNVKLIVTSEIHFDPTWYGTDGVTARALLMEDGTGKVEVRAKAVFPEGTDVKLVVSLWDADGNCVCETTEKGEQAVIQIPAPVCWDGREAPYLYTLKAGLYDEDAMRDQVELRTGFRRTAIDPEQGFFLNGRHMKLNGVAKHQDTADKFSAAGEAEWQQDLELIREIGANAVRLSHYQHPQRVYDLCDSSGLIVWAEIPMLRLLEQEELIRNAREQLKELILQNMHHPSICFYGLENEIAMFGEEAFLYREVRQLHEIAKSLDPDRFTAAANLHGVMYDSPLNHITDVIGYNLYFGWYYGEMPDYASFLDGFHSANARVPLAVTEYGADCNIRFHSTEPVRKDYTEEFQALFHETVYPYIEERDYIWGSFVWNMFDFVSGIRNEGGVRYRNNKGLVTFDRKTRKDAFYYYKARWTKEPFVHITGKRFRNRTGDSMQIKVYSNCQTVVLRMQDAEWGQKSSNGVFLFDKIPFTGNVIRVEAVAGNVSDTAEFCRVEKADASYIYVDPNPGPNVKNWFEDEVAKAKLFPEGRWSVMDVINNLLQSTEVMAVIDESYPEVGAYMRDTVGTFTLEQAAAYEKTLIDEKSFMELNVKLTAIQK